MALIYMGSLDDRVYHYPWTSSRGVYLNTYLNSIVQNILIGHQSAINDGYLLNNPILRDALFLDKKSLLRDLLYTDEIKIPARKSSFSELIAEQSKQGIWTFGKIPKAVLDKIDVIDKIVEGTEARIQGPESMKVWAGFFNLMTTLEKRPFEDLGIAKKFVSKYEYETALNAFLKIAYDTKHPSRTQWEETLEELSKKDRSNGGFNSEGIAKQALMNLGNEAYHYNFAQQLSSPDLRVDVETVHTPAFSDLLDVKKMDIGIDLKDLPLIEIPKLNNLLERKSIESLLDDGYDVAKARNEFIKAFTDFEKIPNHKNFDELRYKANIYNKEIKQAFTATGMIQNIAASTNLILSTVLGTGLISWVAAEIGTRTLVNKFIIEDTKKIDYTKYIMASSKIKTA